MLTLESLMTVGLCSGVVSLAVHLPAAELTKKHTQEKVLLMHRSSSIIAQIDLVVLTLKKIGEMLFFALCSFNFEVDFSYTN